MAFEKGKPKTGGRRSGRVNKFTGTFRDAVQAVYNGLGGHAAFQHWAQSNKTEYYRIASKLIPLEIKGRVNDAVTVIVHRQTSQPIGDEGQRSLEDHSSDHQGGSSC
jgi:hypothetical protein